MNIQKGLSLLFLLFLMLISCSTTSYWMKVANESVQKGDYYKAIKNALMSYDSEKSPGTKKFIEDNYKRGMDQAVNDLSQIQIDINNFKVFTSDARIIASTQKKLRKYGFIQNDVYDIEEMQRNYENALCIKVIEGIKNNINYDNLNVALEDIKGFKEAGLQKTDGYYDILEVLNQKSLSQNNPFIIIGLYEICPEDISLEINGQNYSYLTKAAKYFEKSNEKMKALTLYRFLNNINKDDNDIKNKINSIENDLYCLIAIRDIENSTDEYIPCNNDEFIKNIKKEIDDEENLIKVIVEDGGLTELRYSNIEFKSFTKKPLIKLDFDQDIRYLIVPKIQQFKIYRSSPIKRTKTENWDYANMSMGDSFALGVAHSANYGSYKIQYFEYDEYTDEVTGKIVIDLLVIDLKQEEIVSRKRFEEICKDKAVWAENPMAVGIINKIPATLYPASIGNKMKQRHSTKNDEEIGKELLLKTEAEIIKIIKQTINAVPKLDS